MILFFHDEDCIMPDEYFEDYEEDIPVDDECEDEEVIQRYFEDRD